MTYEYRCSKCDTAFDVIATVAEKSAGLEPKCPNCGSKQTTQIFGAVGVLSSASGPSGDPGGGPMCGPGMGAGCCCNS